MVTRFCQPTSRRFLRRSKVFIPCGSIALASIACSELPRQPKGWDRELRLEVAEDLDPDADRVEVHLRAAPSLHSFLKAGPTELLTYNGGPVGPLIELERGQTLSVHFENQLEHASSLHFHGMRVPISMDGVPGISQLPTEPGESFHYEFVARDAGLYWYHPHVDSAAQVGAGLLGPILVRDPKEPELGDEVVLVLSDLSLVADTGALASPDIGGDFGTLFGREGNVILVNGKVAPRLVALSGKRQRYRILNATRSRYFQIGLPDHEFIVIGSDGGLMSKPEKTEHPVVAPAERLDVLVTPKGAPRAILEVTTIPYEHGFGSTFQREEELLFSIELAEQETIEDLPLPEIQRKIEPFQAEGSAYVEMALTVLSGANGLEMGINGIPFQKAEPLRATVGDRAVWSITNTFDFAHPFHLHGFFFQVLDEDLVPRKPLAWKDTVNVGVGETVNIGIEFDDSPGVWMFHCHILDHAEAGMMGAVDLRRDGQTEPTLGEGLTEIDHAH